jgi:hypothetical protein
LRVALFPVRNDQAEKFSGRASRGTGETRAGLEAPYCCIVVLTASLSGETRRGLLLVLAAAISSSIAMEVLHLCTCAQMHFIKIADVYYSSITKDALGMVLGVKLVNRLLDQFGIVLFEPHSQ